MSGLTVVEVKGSHFEIGVQLGELSREVFDDFLQQSSTWRELQRWRNSAVVERMLENVRREFPWIYEELEGLAKGLNMSLLDVMLWNSRGDLLHSSQDGCTSVTMFTEDGTPVFGHNEDGDPYLYEKCHLVDVTPPAGPSFVSFFYPGSLPGHSFGFNSHNLMHTVNNLRVKFDENDVELWNGGMPRMIVSRALLHCESEHAVLSLLRQYRPIGGFHYTVCKFKSGNSERQCNSTEGRKGASMGVSIEYTPSQLSVLYLKGPVKYVHTNHVIHHMYEGKETFSLELFDFVDGKSAQGCDGVKEIATQSSLNRFQRATSILDSFALVTGEDQCVDNVRIVLSDQCDEHKNKCTLLREHQHDPDEENTLATVFFTFKSSNELNSLNNSACMMRIYDFRVSVSQHPLHYITL